MKLKKNFFLISIIAFFNFSYSQNFEQKKIGVIFNIDGPCKITRQSMGNPIVDSKVLEKRDLFYGAYKFLETGTGNPTERIINAYLKNLDFLNLKITQIKEPINSESDRNYYPDKHEYLDEDLKNIKMKYNLDYLLIVNGHFGLEFEQSVIITGDKRTYIFLNNAFIDLNTNEVVSSFNAGNIANIRKKNILSPPNFPNIEESMNTLLNDKLLPEIERKIKRKIIIP
jgi:hypothetical protein